MDKMKRFLERILAKHPNLKYVLIGLGILLVFSLIRSGLGVLILSLESKYIMEAFANAVPNGPLQVNYPTYLKTIISVNRLLFYVMFLVVGWWTTRKVKEIGTYLAILIGFIWSVGENIMHLGLVLRSFLNYLVNSVEVDQVNREKMITTFQNILASRMFYMPSNVLLITGLTFTGGLLALGWENKRKLKAFVFKR
jgi:hypothetical protein